jgi:hypothetical protein
MNFHFSCLNYGYYYLFYLSLILILTTASSRE